VCTSYASLAYIRETANGREEEERKKEKKNNKGKRKKKEAPKNSYVTHTVSCSLMILILLAVNLVRRKADQSPPSHAEGLGEYRTLLSQFFRRVRLFPKSFISNHPAVHRSARISAAPTG